MNNLLRGVSAESFGNWKNGFVWYVVRFIFTFLVLYFGTLAIIGLSSRDNFYSPFISHYLDFITPLRHSLLICSKIIVESIGYEANFKDEFTLAIRGTNGVRMVYSCVGYGVLSFWAAFIIANKGAFLKKIQWLVVGLFILWSLNVMRVTFLLLADVKNWVVPFGLDHHTLFNLLAYSLIFMLIYIYDRQNKLSERIRI